MLFDSDEGAAIYRRRADGSGSAELIGRLLQDRNGMTLHKDGKTLIARGESGPSNPRQLLILRLGTDSKPTPLFAAPGGERDATFSPDGRAIAYVSAQSGRPEVYVRPFPDVESRKLQVSLDGGVAPHWNPAGGELFYLSAAGDLMVARLATSPGLTLAAVTRLFTPQGFQGMDQRGMYDVAPDGQRFLMLDITAAPSNAASERIVMVQNFAAILRERLPR